VRVLFTTRPLVGHYTPMRPLMDALRDHGDDVALASGDPIASQARRDGFVAFRIGLDTGHPALLEQRRIMESLPPPQIRPFVYSEWFVRTEIPPRLPDLHVAIREFRPDVLVHDTAELAAPIAARVHGLPFATHSFGPMLPVDTAAIAGDAAAPLWREQGLEPHPRAGLYGDVYLDICPPSLQAPTIGAVEAVQLVGPPRQSRGAAVAAVPLLDDLGGRPIVYVTLGTVFNRNVDLFRTLVGAVRDEDVDVIVTVGRDNDPSALGEQPANVRVERFVDQALLLPRCSLAITHGGAGSTFGALAFGVPLLVVPQSADHFANAERVVAAGAGLAIQPGDLGAETVAAATRRLLSEDAFRTAARRIDAEFDAMPEPAACRPVLARLAGTTE
jgi:UDP:flavonoid glycosyltransferase YjiC (YdhE family)